MSINSTAIEKAALDAIAKSEEKKKRKFVESIDVIVNLKNINLKDPTKRFNNEIELPHAITNNPKLCFFLDGDQLVEAKQLDVEVLGPDEIDALSKADKSEKRNFVNKFDFFIASQLMMRFVAQNFGKILGPKGKMPRPPPQGHGIIRPSESIAPLVDKFKKIVRVKLGKYPLIQFKVGNKAMDIKEIVDNIEAALNFIEHKLEKGRQNLRSIYVKTTMGAPVKIL
ncbi:MAG: 50S ribosomal protein L1 [Promethearchaeota archaeon]